MTPAQVRKVALSLPEVTEQDHWGKPSFRVKGRIFATMQPEAKTVNLLKLAPEEQDMVVGEKAFKILAWGKQPYVQVDLATVDAALFEELLVTCWRRVAPKRAIAAYEGR
jgi:hypothetical protein